MLIEQLNTLMPSYDEYLGKKDLSNKTIKAYKLAIVKFIEYLEHKYINPPSAIENINNEHVLTFIEFKAKKGASIFNQDTYFKYIKYFFEYLYYEKTMKTLILQNVPGFVLHRDKFDREYGYFSIEELNKIIDKAKKIHDEEKAYFSFRNFVIIVIFAYAGLTLSELYNLDEEDIDFESKKITIRGVKSKSQPRSIYISKKLEILLKEYLNVKNCWVQSPFLFISREKNRMSLKTIQNSVKNIINVSDIELKNRTFSPKTIRHTVIKTMVDNDTELPVICNITGLELKTLHKYIQNYTAVSDLKEELFLEDHPILRTLDIEKSCANST